MSNFNPQFEKIGNILVYNKVITEDDLNKAFSSGPNKKIFSGADDLVKSGEARTIDEAESILSDPNKFKKFLQFSLKQKSKSLSCPDLG